MNKHSFKSLFSSLFGMKGDLISQNRRLGLAEFGVGQVAFSAEQPLSGVVGFHTLALVHDLAVAACLPINKAELFAKRFKSAVRHNHLDFFRGDLPSWFGGRSHSELCSMCRIKQILRAMGCHFLMIPVH